MLATRHSAIPIDRFSYHSLGSSPITWNKFLIHPEDRHLAERLAIHLTQLLIPSNENANHEVRSFSRNTWRATNFCKSVLVFDLDLKKKHGFLATWDGVNDTIINGSASAILFPRLIYSMT